MENCFCEVLEVKHSIHDVACTLWKLYDVLESNLKVGFPAAVNYIWREKESHHSLNKISRLMQKVNKIIECEGKSERLIYFD